MRVHFSGSSNTSPLTGVGDEQRGGVIRGCLHSRHYNNDDRLNIFRLFTGSIYNLESGLLQESLAVLRTTMVCSDNRDATYRIIK